MAHFESKAALMQSIQLEREKLKKLLAPLTESQMTQARVCGEWSIQDILAHLMEWEEMVISWYQAGLRGEIPKIPSPDFKWNETPLLNQRIYEKHRHRAFPEVHAEFNATDETMNKMVEAMSEEELLKAGNYAWTGKLPLASYVNSATAAHYRWASGLIRKCVKAPKS